MFEDGVQQDVSFFAASERAARPGDPARHLGEHERQDADGAAGGDRLRVARCGRAIASRVVDIKDTVRDRCTRSTTMSGGARRGDPRHRRASGGTALYNGLYMTLKEMVKQRRQNGDVRRQAIAVLSDGDDTASLVDVRRSCWTLAKQAGIAIYTITLEVAVRGERPARSGSRYFSQSEFAMKSLAQETGARSFFPTDIAELAGVYGTIAEELANQYALGYTSKNPKRDGAFRRVVVRVEDRPGARTRTRSRLPVVATRSASATNRTEIVVTALHRASGFSRKDHNERRDRAGRAARRFVAIGWVALLVAAPVPPAPRLLLCYALGSLICHQIPNDRSTSSRRSCRSARGASASMPGRRGLMFGPCVARAGADSRRFATGSSRSGSVDVRGRDRRGGGRRCRPWSRWSSSGPASGSRRTSTRALAGVPLGCRRRGSWCVQPAWLRYTTTDARLDGRSRQRSASLHLSDLRGGVGDSRRRSSLARPPAEGPHLPASRCR